MSPCIRRNLKPSELQSAQSRDQILSEIASRRGIQRQLEAQYIAWSIPKTPNDETRGRAQAVKVNLLGLCSPGHTLFETTVASTSSPVTGSSPDLSKQQQVNTQKKLARFTSTAETRCVRDIKRIFSWKIYGVSCNQETNEQAHYVRISLASRTSDRHFEALAHLLDAIVAKRHLALPDVHPFGVGVDSGVPADHARIHLISNCAKLTPFLRKVTVDFEVYLDDEWQRLDGLKVDRFGFATYKSAPQGQLLEADGPESVHFSDDPYVRFARVTLRFGDRPERAFIDIEGTDAAPYISRQRKSCIVYLPKVRTRINDGNVTRRPVCGMVRLVFREKDGFFRGKHAAAEAMKLADLIKKTTGLAARNTLGIRSFVKDADIVTMPMGGIVSQSPYALRQAADATKHPQKADITPEFADCTLYAVPRGGGGGITLVSQSRDGEYVLRQHIENPVGLISCITARGFNVSSSSTLITTRTRTRYTGTGTLRYIFNHGEADAEVLVAQLVGLLNRIDDAQQMPSRLPLLTKVLAQKQRSRLAHARSRAHMRSDSNASDSSNFSDTSNVSVPSSDTSEDNSDLDSPDSSVGPPDELAFLLYEAPNDTQIYEADAELVLCEAPGDFGGVELDSKPAKVPMRELPADPSKLCRSKHDYAATLPREVDMRAGELVSVEYRNNYWSFVRVPSGEEGWVPTGFLT